MTFLRVPPSAKLRVAACHLDFTLQGLGALPESLVPKLDRVEALLEEMSIVPHLVVFPEGAGCEALYSRAETWARRFGVNTICGTAQMGQHVAGVIVKASGERELFFKQRLSPHDAPAAKGSLLQGPAAGVELVVDCQTATGDMLPAGVRVLICYDFRYYQPAEQGFNSTQMVIVAMHDLREDEPEQFAARLAKRQYLRTLLVNKAQSQGRALRSSAFGPLPSPFAQHLKSSGVDGVDEGNNRIWRTSVEGVTYGEYEIGQYAAPGHDTAYGAGFFYNVRHYPFEERQTARNEVPPMWKRLITSLAGMFRN